MRKLSKAEFMARYAANTRQAADDPAEREKAERRARDAEYYAYSRKMHEHYLMTQSYSRK